MYVGYVLVICTLISGCDLSLSTVDSVTDKLDGKDYSFSAVTQINDTNGVNVSTTSDSLIVNNNVSQDDELSTTDSVLVIENNNTVDEVQNVHNDSDVKSIDHDISTEYSVEKSSLEGTDTSLPTPNTDVTNHTDTTSKIETTKHLRHKYSTISPVPDFRGKTTFHVNANLPFHVPYMIHGESGNRQSLLLQGSKRATLKHHLQLVPMEDEPLGAMMVKDQRYVISVLVPIAIGVLGAALIAGTVFSLRYIARRRAIEAPIDDDFDIERDHSPCIPSISGDTTDKVFLLMGDDEG